MPHEIDLGSHLVHVVAHGEVKDAAVQVPDELQFVVGNCCVKRPHAAVMSHFAAISRQQLLAYQLDVALIQRRVRQARVHIDANPVGPVGGFGILPVKLDQPLAQRQRPVLQQRDPLLVPAAFKNSLVNLVYQGLFVCKVAVQKRLRDAQPFREFPGLTRKPDFGKISDRTVDDLALPRRWHQARSGWRCRGCFRGARRLVDDPAHCRLLIRP